jgi:hypothetical protein
MQCIYPTLVLAIGFPKANNLVAILIELHPQAMLMVWVTTKAVIPIHTHPWIDNLLHISFIIV